MSSRVEGRPEVWINNDDRQLEKLQRRYELARHAEMEAVPQPGDGELARIGIICVVIVGILTNVGLALLLRTIFMRFG